MPQKLTVQKDGEEYDVSADSDGVVWLSNDEIVINNPENLEFHSPRPDGKTEIESQAQTMGMIAVTIMAIVLVILMLS